MFETIERLMSDTDLSLTGAVMKNLENYLGMQQLEVLLHAQSNGIVDRLNRTLCRDIAGFVVTMTGDWDQHVLLAFFRYHSEF